MKSRYKTARRLLIFWTLFIGLGAVAGASGMLLDPTGKAMGMDSMLPYFQKLPFADVLFQDYVFPGIALLIVNGISNLTAAALLFAGKKSGVFLGGLFGVTIGALCLLTHLAGLESMGESYLAPFSGVSGGKLLLRRRLNREKFRAPQFRTLDERNQK